MTMHRTRQSRAVRVGMTALLTVLLPLATASSRGWAASGPPETFGSPEQAVDSLVAATRNTRLKELRQILGDEGRALIWSGDRVADRLGRDTFIAAYDQSHRLQATGADAAVLIVGSEQWPFPIPLVRNESGWHFDTPAGVQEILNRRIGRNELSVIDVCRAFVIAQREYAARDPMGTGLGEFASKFLSTPGARDGLYWPTQADEPPSPLGPLVARARAEGYQRRPPPGLTPYHGYYYRILTRQGTSAPGGARDYIVDGHMRGGFALVAFPAKYGNSGVMTFLVNQTGIVYQKNLGPNTSALTVQLTAFDPDATWTTP
jgi:hypothetical protein